MPIKRRKSSSRTAARGGPAKRGAPALHANVAKLRALAHPLRLRLLELFAESPRTTKQVADLLGQPPTRLYHHVNALERAGLLQLRETRPNRGVVEKWFGAGPRYAAGAPANPADASVRNVAATVLDQSRHEVVSALQQGNSLQPRPLVLRGIVIGPRSKQEQVRERVQQFIRDLGDEGRQPAKGKSKRRPAAGSDVRWALTITFAPVAEAIE